MNGETEVDLLSFHLLTVLYRDTLSVEKQGNIGQWIIEVYEKLTESLLSST